MGCNKNINNDKFPEKGIWIGKKVKICFDYDTKTLTDGVIVRDDAEEPFETIIMTRINGEVVYLRACECQYQLSHDEV